MTHHERLYDCLNNTFHSETPVSFWRHFPHDDQNAVSLANVTVDWQKKYDFDFVKVTPSSSFCLKDWGVQDVFTDNPFGLRTYPDPLVKSPEDWSKLTTLDPERGYLAQQITVLKYIKKILGNSVPVIQSVFSPMVQLENLAGNQTMNHHMACHPEFLQQGLDVITRSTVLFVEKAAKIGIDGIFYIIKHPSPGRLSPSQYITFGLPNDLRCLSAAEKLWFNMLHLHISGVNLEPFLHLPTKILSVHEIGSLDAMKNLAMAAKPICGGLERENLFVNKTPQDIFKQSKTICDTMKNLPFILGADCGLHINTPELNIRAAIKAVRNKK